MGCFTLEKLKNPELSTKQRNSLINKLFKENKTLLTRKQIEENKQKQIRARTEIKNRLNRIV